MINTGSPCAEDLEFNYRAIQTLHSVANGSPPLKHLLKIAVCLVAVARWAPQTRYTLQRNMASIIKDLVML